jgi:hypothetical protein
MVQSKATTVREYLAGLPEDRRKAIQAIRKVVNANLDPKFQEGIQYGMIGWSVPHSVYPAGYHCDPKQPLPFASVASQKNHMAVYLFCIYGDPQETERFVKAWKATGKKLDMGKGCVRFKKLEDVPLDVLGDAIKRITAERFIAQYEANVAKPRSGARKTAKKKTAKKAAKRVTKKQASGAAARKVAKKAAKRATRKKAARKAAR